MEVYLSMNIFFNNFCYEFSVKTLNFISENKIRLPMFCMFNYRFIGSKKEIPIYSNIVIKISQNVHIYLYLLYFNEKPRTLCLKSSTKIFSFFPFFTSKDISLFIFLELSFMEKN